MGFFNNLLSDLSEIGSNKAKFKRKLTDFSKLLADYSFGDLPVSRELGRQKIIVAYNDLMEFSQGVDKNQVIKLYLKSGNVDLTIEAALVAADLWLKAVVDNHLQLTNSFIKKSINQAKDKLKIEFAESLESEKLKSIFPELVRFLDEMSQTDLGMNMVVNSSQEFEYRFPILTFGQLMGYNHVGVRKFGSNDFRMYCFAISLDELMMVEPPSRVINVGVTEVQFSKMFNEMMQEIVSNPEYLRIATPS